MDTAAELEVLLHAQEEDFGVNHVKVASTLAAMADLLAHYGRFAEAEPLYWRVLEIRHKIGGQSNLDVAATLEDLANLYELQENYSETERLLRWAADIRKKLCGPTSAEYTDTIARLRRLVGDVQVDTVEDMTPSPVPQPRESFPWLEQFDYGVDLQEREEFFAAEQYFKSMLAFAQHFAPLTVQHARALDHLARTYLFQARFKESRELFEQALAIFENASGISDLDTVECLEGTADAHASLDEPEQARFLYSWALNVAQQQGFTEPVERITCKLAALPFVSGKRAEEAPVRTSDPSTVNAAHSGMKRSIVAVKPAIPAEVQGGLNALLEPIGPPPKNKTVNVVKPVLAESATPGQAENNNNLSVAEAHCLPPPAPVRKKTTAAILKPVTAVETTAEVAAGGLDALLKDIGPPRKKTTASIVKPVTAQPAAVAPVLESGGRSGGAESFGSSAMQQLGDDHIHQSALQPVASPVNHPEPSGCQTISPEADLTLAQSSLADSDVKPVTARKKTGSVSKTGKKTANVAKSGTSVNRVGSAPGDISQHQTGVTPPGLAGEVEPTGLRIGKPGVDTAMRKSPRPWQKPERPPLEHLYLSSDGLPGRGKPSAGPEAAEPLRGTACPSAQAGVAGVNNMMWEKYAQQAERCVAQRNLQEAERLYLLALEKAELFGESDPRLWKTQAQLARVYEADKKFVRAGHLYRLVLQAVEKHYGPTHKEVIFYLEKLGELYTTQDRWDEAEAIYQQIHKVLQRTGSKNQIADCLGKLGLVQRRRQQR